MGADNGVKASGDCRPFPLADAYQTLGAYGTRKGLCLLGQFSAMLPKQDFGRTSVLSAGLLAG